MTDASNRRSFGCVGFVLYRFAGCVRHQELDVKRPQARHFTKKPKKCGDFPWDN
jgi:hypothetical protein